MFTVYKANVSH